MNNKYFLIGIAMAMAIATIAGLGIVSAFDNAYAKQLCPPQPACLHAPGQGFNPPPGQGGLIPGLIGK